MRNFNSWHFVFSRVPEDPVCEQEAGPPGRRQCLHPRGRQDHRDGLRRRQCGRRAPRGLRAGHIKVLQGHGHRYGTEYVVTKKPNMSDQWRAFF